MVLVQPWLYEAKVVANSGRKEFTFGTSPVCVSWDPKLASPREYNPQYDFGTWSLDNVRWIECLTGVTEEDIFGSSIPKSGLWTEILNGPSPANSYFSVTITNVEPKDPKDKPK